MHQNHKQQSGGFLKRTKRGIGLHRVPSKGTFTFSVTLLTFITMSAFKCIVCLY